MTTFRFTFSAKVFSREHLEAEQKPIETFQGHFEAESYLRLVRRLALLFVIAAMSTS